MKTYLKASAAVAAALFASAPLAHADDTSIDWDNVTSVQSQVPESLYTEGHEVAQVPGELFDSGCARPGPSVAQNPCAYSVTIPAPIN